MGMRRRRPDGSDSFCDPCLFREPCRRSIHLPPEGEEVVVVRIAGYSRRRSLDSLYLVASSLLWLFIIIRGCVWCLDVVLMIYLGRPLEIGPPSYL